MGRPSLKTPEVCEEIIQRIGDGESLRKICMDEHMPARRTVEGWLEADAEFCAKHARAREAQADYMADKIVEESYAATPADVQVAKLRVDTLKWLAARLAPKKYGDSTTLKGDPDNPVALAVSEIARRVIDAKPDA